jgi:hypothetical protein
MGSNGFRLRNLQSSTDLKRRATSACAYVFVYTPDALKLAFTSEDAAVSTRLAPLFIAMVILANLSGCRRPQQPEQPTEPPTPQSQHQ